MAEIVDLGSRRSPEPGALAYWRCGCGCMTYFLRSDGLTECANCLEIDSAEGFWRLPSKTIPPRPETDEEGPSTNVVNMETPEAALTHLLDWIDLGQISAVVVLENSGAVRTWGPDLITRELRGWLRRQLETARKQLVGP